MAALREVFALFDIEVNSEELAKAGQKVHGFTEKLRAVAPVLAEAFAFEKIREFVGETIEAGARLNDLSDRLGVNSTLLQEWQYAAKLAGVEGESAAHSLGFLNKAVGEAVTGGKEQAQTFQALHVAVKGANGATRTTADVLYDVADALQKIPDQQTRAAYAMKLFGREGQTLLPLLQEGSGGLRKMNAEFQELGGGMSEDFVKGSDEIDDNLARLNVSWTSLKTTIVGAALPAILKVTNVIKAGIKPVIDWLRTTNTAKTGLLALSAVLSVKVVTSLITVARTLGILKGSVMATLRAFAGFAWPLVVAGLLYLAFDDLFTLLDGGDSEIGAILEKFAGVAGKEKFVDSLKESWQAYLSIFSGGGNDTLDATNGKLEAQATTAEIVGWALYETFNVLKLGFDMILTTGVEAWDILKGIAKTFVALDNGDAWSHPIDTLKESFKDLGPDAARMGGLVYKDGANILAPGGRNPFSHPATAGAAGPAAGPAGEVSVGPLQYGQGSSAPKVAPSAAGYVRGDVKVGQIQIVVQGGTNPDETGKRVGRAAATELEKQNRDAAANLQGM